jgi:hypothetical protein
MRQIVFLAGLALTALACTATADDTGKGTPVDLDGMTSKTPSSWVKEAPSNRMRFAQFKLPKAKDDKEDAELIIFKGLGGSAKANIERWKKQFVPPKGKTIDEISKVTEIKIGGSDATLLDVQGTYLYNPAPFNPRSKSEPRPDYRMLAIHFEGPKDVYHIKLTGPAKTVEQYRKGFDEWIKGFKK